MGIICFLRTVVANFVELRKAEVRRIYLLRGSVNWLRMQFGHNGLWDMSSKKRRGGVHTMKMEILYFDGCPTYLKAEKTLREVLKEQGIAAEVELVAVNTDGEP